MPFRKAFPLTPTSNKTVWKLFILTFLYLRLFFPCHIPLHALRPSSTSLTSPFIVFFYTHHSVSYQIVFVLPFYPSLPSGVSWKSILWNTHKHYVTLKMFTVLVLLTGCCRTRIRLGWPLGIRTPIGSRLKLRKQSNSVDNCNNFWWNPWNASHSEICCKIVCYWVVQRLALACYQSPSCSGVAPFLGWVWYSTSFPPWSHFSVLMGKTYNDSYWNHVEITLKAI